MKIAVAIPTCNADAENLWQQVLSAFADQSLQPELRLICDSASEDDTGKIAEKAGWQVMKISRSEFNHGLTRQRMLEVLAEQGAEVVIMATQDAIPGSEDTLKVLVENLISTGAAVSYARQISRNKGSFDHFSREKNYPPESRLKSKADIPQLGLMTAFCSDTLAAWRVDAVMAAGGFPETEFGEDTLLAAKLLARGEKVSYCAESFCFHTHKDSIFENFHRGLAIGRMHAANPFLGRDFGSPGVKGARQFCWRHMGCFAAKTLGFILGKAGGGKRS